MTVVEVRITNRPRKSRNKWEAYACCDHNVGHLKIESNCRDVHSLLCPYEACGQIQPDRWQACKRYDEFHIFLEHQTGQHCFYKVGLQAFAIDVGFECAPRESRSLLWALARADIEVVKKGG